MQYWVSGWKNPADINSRKLPKTYIQRKGRSRWGTIIQLDLQYMKSPSSKSMENSACKLLKREKERGQKRLNYHLSTTKKEDLRVLCIVLQQESHHGHITSLKIKEQHLKFEWGVRLRIRMSLLIQCKSLTRNENY